LPECVFAAGNWSPIVAPDVCALSGLLSAWEACLGANRSIIAWKNVAGIERGFRNKRGEVGFGCLIKNTEMSFAWSKGFSDIGQGFARVFIGGAVPFSQGQQAAPPIIIPAFFG
jgi:hypothetical protein